MFRTALRNVLAHKARLLMTVLAVMLGVAFVSGTLIYSDTLSSAYKSQATKSLSGVAVGVEARTYANDPDAKGLTEKQIQRIAALDGVTSVTPSVGGFAGAADRSGTLLAQGWSNVGGNFAPGKDGKDPRYTFADGHGPTASTEIALDRATADKGGYKVGDTVRVATNKPAAEYTLAGVFTTEDGAVNAGGSLVLFDNATAQKMFLEPGHYQSLTVGAKPGTDNAALAAAVKKLVPDTASTQSAAALEDEQVRMVQDATSSLTQVLLGFAGIALFVGVFLISNTFTMLVAQRTKELALMRAVGASRKQITRSVLAEAMIVGLVASVVGFVLGLGMAAAMGPLLDSMDAQMPAGDLVVGPTPLIAALAVGVLITMLAAWLPGRRAAKIPPVAAMNSVHATPNTKSLVVRNTIGAIVTAIGAGLIVLGAAQAGEGARLIIGSGAFLTLLGVIVLIPLLSRPVIGLVQPLLTRVFKVSGKLAGLNSVRNPRRTGATASALAIGLTLVTGLSVLGVTMGSAIDRSTSEQVKADYTVQMANQSQLDGSLVDAIAKAPGVTVSTPRMYGSVQTADGNLVTDGVNPEALGPVLTFKVLDGSRDSLAQGEIAVNKTYRDKYGYTLGKQLPVTYEDGKKGTLKVGAVFEDNEFLSETVMDTKALAPHYQQPMFYNVYVKMDGGASAANKQVLADATGKNPAIVMMDQNDLRNQVGGMITTLLNIMYGLLAMALVISVLGVVNTLAMSVFERQQEIGMLRAIGLDRGRVKTMIRLESVVISLFGAVVGVVLGVFIAWAIGETVKDKIPGYALELPWDRIGIFLLLAGVVGVLAAMWPARSAARLNMLSAIKAE